MIHHRMVDGAGVRIHVAEQGPPDGPYVVMLHGFPEGWSAWTAQMSALSSAGFRVLAPDLRGYGGSDKPHGIAHYKSSLIADDIAAVIRSLAAGPVVLVGHDWGAPIAYRLVMDHPELVSRLVIMNGPHPTHFVRVLRTSSAQRRRSWYIFAFQLPWLPERQLLRRGTMASIFRGAIDEESLREREQAFAQPYAATAAINFYRAARLGDRRPRQPIIDKDVLIVWGMRDFALGPECITGLEPYLPRLRIERLPNVGHFLQEEAPDEVNAILLRELASKPPSGQKTE